jgi:lipopolysaccharide heptosyltransferase II
MTNPSPSSPLSPRRILVRSVNWLGDAVMTTPALQRLREALPDAHLALLTHEKLASLWERHPSIDAILTFSPGESPWSVARRLRAERFQTAVVLPNSPRSALEVWLARIPQRIGYTRPCWSWLLTRAISPRPGKGRMSRRSVSEVRRLISLPAGNASPASQRPQDRTAHQIYDYLHLVSALGADTEPLPPRLEITAAEMQQTEQDLLAELRRKAANVAAGTPLILLGLNPGAEYGPAKRWPAESFAAVAREVSRKHGNCAWLAFGSAGDWQLCSDIDRLAGGGVMNLAGKTSLRQLMALLKLCRVLLTNDSGPMHVAAALGTPVVVPFGSTSPVLTGPGLPGDTRHQLLQADAPCSPCFRRVCPIDFRCMTGISPDRIVDAVLQAIRPR